MDPDLHYGLVRFLSDDKIPDTIDQETQRLVKKTSHLYTLNKSTLFKLEESRQGTLDPSRGRQHRNLRHVIPRHQMYSTLHNLHDHHLAGHQGQINTYQRAIENYYWPGMKDDIVEYVRSCKTCQQRQRRSGEAPLQPIHKQPIPFYQVGIDVMGPLPKTLTGKRYIVIAVDHFTKWVEARAISEADAQSITQFIYEDIICRHGIPTILSSDRGSEFINELVTALTNVYKIKHIRTSAYHPQGNGQVERVNKTIKDILAKITPKNPGDWSHYLPSALFVTRTTRQASTKFSPSELLHGHQIRHHFGEDDATQEPKDPIEYAQEEFGRIKAFRNQAHKFIQKAQERQKLTHDSTNTPLEPLNIGDLVLVWQTNVEVNMSAKLEKRYKGPYFISKVKGTTYWLRNRYNGTIHPKPYHRNRLKLYHERHPLSPRPVVEIPVRRSSDPKQNRTPSNPHP
jgi:transposase InsO family protein